MQFQNLPPNVLRKILKNHVYAEASPREVARLKTVSKNFRNSGTGYGSKKEWENAVERVRNALKSATTPHGYDTITSHKEKERDALEIVKRMHGDIPAMNYVHGQTVLMMAARRGDVRAAEMLLRRGVIDIDAKDDGPFGHGGGTTALIHAIQSHAPDNDTTKMVDLLLRWKANPNATFFSQTALQSAVSRAGSLPMVKSLLKHGARMRVSRSTTNLLMLAALHKRLDIVKFFLEMGFFNVNATDKYGVTALHYALNSHAQNGLDIVKLLVLHGADPAKVDPIFHRNGYNTIRNVYGAGAVTEIRKMRKSASSLGPRISRLSSRVSLLGSRAAKSLFGGGARMPRNE
jgi:ankyrin repeat protein